MELCNIPKAFYEEVQIAAENIYRYDRFDRFALIVVLTAAEHNQKVEEIFLKQAEMALQRHSVKRKLYAA